MPTNDEPTTCMHVDVSMCVRACVCVACVHVCMHACMCVCVRACMCACMRACMCVCTFMCVSTYVHLHVLLKIKVQSLAGNASNPLKAHCDSLRFQ